MSKNYNDIQKLQDKHLEELFKYLRMPSLSSENLGIEEMAKSVKELMEEIGFKVQELRVGESYPYILGNWGVAM